MYTIVERPHQAQYKYSNKDTLTYEFFLIKI